MSNRALFEEAIQTMSNWMEKTINDFSNAYDALDVDFNVHPLFTIASPKVNMLKSIATFNDRQACATIATLCKKLCIANGRTVIEGCDFKNVDFFEKRNGMKIGYLVSTREEYMWDLEDAAKSGMTHHVTIVLQNNLLNLPPNSHKYRSYPYRTITSRMSLESFFDDVCPGEYEVFQEYIGRFNYDTELMLGLTVSPIPTAKAIKDKWEKVRSEFDSFFFEEKLLKHFDKNEIQILQKLFSDKNILQISNAPFAQSFVGSEWYYDLRVTTDWQMEQTAIVAGYLKSIEQLLFAIMISRCDELKFTLRVKGKNNRVPLSTENYKSLLTMATDLVSTIRFNYINNLEAVFCDQAMGEKLLNFLTDFFKNTRNGYFHKDNIYSKEEVMQIRESAYCALFLLGSLFVFDPVKLETNWI